MEKTGCEIIRGAPTTLAVKGLMMMMMCVCVCVCVYVCACVRACVYMCVCVRVRARFQTVCMVVDI